MAKYKISAKVGGRYEFHDYVKARNSYDAHRKALKFGLSESKGRNLSLDSINVNKLAEYDVSSSNYSFIDSIIAKFPKQTKKRK